MKNEETQIIFDIASKDKFILRILMDRINILNDNDFILVLNDLNGYRNIHTEFQTINYSKIDRVELQSKLQIMIDSRNDQFFELISEINNMDMDDYRRNNSIDKLNSLML